MASPFLAASSSSSASSPLSYLIPRPSSSSLVPQGFSCGAALQAQQAGVYGGNSFGVAAPPAGGFEAAAEVRQGGRHAGHPPLPRPPPRQCPRCRSANTKFCYYNNYSRKQPRYFCRACRRHWTEGGTLRDVPVGGGRKNRRNGGSKSSGGAKAPSTTTAATAVSAAAAAAGHVQGSIGAGAIEAFVPADILRQMLFHPASFTAVGGGSGYGIDLGAWQQMAAATAPQQGTGDVATVEGTAPAADANCGAGVPFYNGWQAQDDMSGFDEPF